MNSKVMDVDMSLLSVLYTAEIISVSLHVNLLADFGIVLVVLFSAWRAEDHRTD